MNRGKNNGCSGTIVFIIIVLILISIFSDNSASEKRYRDSPQYQSDLRDYAYKHAGDF